MVLATLAALPVAVYSLVQQIEVHSHLHSYSLSLPDLPHAPTYTRLQVDIAAVDEVQRQISLRVSGYHVCPSDCSVSQRVVFYSLNANVDSQAVPPSDSLTLPRDSSEVIARITLPIRGELLTYPFDRWRLRLGVVVQQVNPDGSVTYLTPQEAGDELFIRIQEQLPRLEMAPPRQLPAGQYSPAGARFHYLYVNDISFSRPVYLRVLIILILALIGAATAYAVSFRPFDQLIINAGALVLGVWGIRSLVLGSFPPDVTAVDISLTILIFLLLFGITLRALAHTHAQAALPPQRKRRAPDETE